jgi:citrate lyase subunit beta/citryl-CoA lyase
VNAATTGLLFDDLNAVVRPGLDAVLLSKAENVEDVQQTAAAIENHEAQRGMKQGSAEIILQIENALGVYNCFNLIKASRRVAATCFGSARDGDLQTDLGCSWSIEGTELLYARSKVLLDSRAAGSHILPLDGVFSDLSDESGLIADSRLSARLGFIGRTVIHPKQISPVKSAYAVPEADVAYYQKVVVEFAAAEKAGTAAISVDGKLVDYAMAQRARRVLELASLDRPR